jgi:RHS repeat-associated protein
MALVSGVAPVSLRTQTSPRRAGIPRLATLAVLVAPVVAHASVSISPTTSYNGAYTVSWTDASGGATRAYLASSFNGGAWSKVTVTGTYSRSYSAMPVGTYSYKIQIYRYDLELRKELFERETSVASVLVTTPSAPAAPGPISGPTSTTIGTYSLAWGAAAPPVDRYELQENGVLIQSGTARSASFSGKGSGTYTYRARACNAYGCGAFNPEFQVTVVATLTTTVPNDTFVQPVVPEQQWVGALPGSASTDGGSARYDIPIEVPPGRAGMQPDVVLAYSSSNGNGIAGVGWSLSGVSSIYRCPRTIDQEGAGAPVQFTAADRLCMDGKRLVQPGGDGATYGRSGSEYRTEVDDFARVRLKDADMWSEFSYFDVEHKSGVTSRYKVPNGNYTTTVMTWRLAAEFDRQDNCVAYEHQLFNVRSNHDAEWVLSRISYTGTWSGTQCSVTGDARTVEFQYTDRPDRRTTFVAGKATMTTARLAGIVTKVGAQAVRRYELKYRPSVATGRSLLDGVTVCAGATCGGAQLPATRFEYQEDDLNGAFAGPEHLVGPDGTLGPEWDVRLVGDYDGDGKRDVYLQRNQSAQGGAVLERKLQLSRDGSTHPLDRHLELKIHGLNQFLDIDYDGRADILGWDNDAGKVTVGSWKNGTWEWRPTNIGVPAFGTIDYDGDGRIDVANYNEATRTRRVFRRTCVDSLDCFVDMDTSPLPAPGLPYVEQMFPDFNGDGISDTFFDVWEYEDPPTNKLPQIRFHKRDGTYDLRNVKDLGCANLDSFSNSSHRRWADVNGDGLLDIYDPDAGRVCLNRGGEPRTNMFAVVPFAPPDPAIHPLRAQVAVVMDVDADGRDELMVPNVRTRIFCGGPGGFDGQGEDILWWCGDEFDLGGAAEVYDWSVFRWDAYRFRETLAGTFEMVRVPTNLEAPVRQSAELDDWYGDGVQDAQYKLIKMRASDGTLLGYYPGLSDDPQTHGPYISRNHARAPDLLTAATRHFTQDVENGPAATAAWSHQPLSRAEVPQGCDPAHGAFYAAHHDDDHSLGYVFFTSSMWAVSRFDVSHGVSATASPTNATCYRYEDAMLSAFGRGFQGFKKITSEERLPQALGEETPDPYVIAAGCGTVGTPCSVNNLISVTEFNQEFPFTNRVKKVTVHRAADLGAGAKPISETEYSWKAKSTTDPSPGVAPGIWVVYPSLTVERKYDLGQASGLPLSTTTSISEVDLASGEPQRLCTIVDDSTAPTGGQATLAWEDRAPLFNDVASWWLGRVDRRETVKDFIADFTPDPDAPSCPTPTRSADSRIQLVNYQWYATTAAQGSRRKLQSEQLVVRGAIEATTTNTYEGFGNLWTKQATGRDVIGTIGSTFTYTGAPDQGYFLATETNTLGHVTTLVTDPATGKERTHQAVQGGPWTRTEYDALGRTLTVTTDGAPPASERLAWCVGCAEAVMTRQVIQAGTPTQVEYLDLLGRVVATESEGLTDNPRVLTQVRYNERGLKVAESPPRFATYAPWDDAAPPPYLTTYSRFDALGRPRTKTVARDPALFTPGKGEPTLTTEYTYEGFKTRISVNRAAGQAPLRMSRTVNAQGKFVETVQTVTSPSTHDLVTRYGYDPSGAVTRITDAGGNVITATYDDLSRKMSMSDPDRGHWTYQWDGLSRLLSQTDARGAVITQEYDAIGRVTLRKTTAASNGATTVDAIWTYDQDGRVGLLNRVDGTSQGTTSDFVRTYAYDDLLRPYRVTTMIRAGDAVQLDGYRTFTMEYGYDHGFGRLKAMRYPGVAGNGETVAIDYSPTTATMGGGQAIGETEILANFTRGKQYRRATTVSPRGAVTDQVFGNCTAEHANYDASSGMATFMTALRPSAAASPCPAALELVRQVEYGHDHLLNLERQMKNIAGLQATEVFEYDELQRLTKADRSWGTTPPAGQAQGYAETVSYAYDDLGNITAKSDYAGTYAYGTSARAERLAGPHAVSSVTKVDGTSATFTYDANGNLVVGDGRVIEFNLLDRPERVCGGTSTPCPPSAPSTEFRYAPDGTRYRQSIWDPVERKYGAKTVYYVDKDYELVVWGDLHTEERTYVGASVVVYRSDAGPRQVRYQHLDRLGSVDALTDGDAQKVMLDLHGYDPFGKPRAEAWTSSGDRLHPAGDRGATTDRGFTGHEHLDLHHLIHMNGRVYDYRLGRFLSVDPFIADPLDSQAINPYSYIGNNPLSGVDPTGYCATQGAKTGREQGAPNGCGAQSKANDNPTAPGLKSAREQGSIYRAGSNVTVNGASADTAAGIAILQTWSGARVPGATSQPAGQPSDMNSPASQNGEAANATGLGSAAQVIKDTAVGGAKAVVNNLVETANLVNRVVDAALSVATEFQFGQIVELEGSTPGEKSAMAAVLVGGLVTPSGGMKLAGKAVDAYEVGLSGALRLRSVVGDGLDAHHVGQAYAMERLVPGYSRLNAPAIMVPRVEHAAIPALRGAVLLSPRQLLARDIISLRRHTNAPNGSLMEAIRLNRQMYPEAFTK